MAMTTNRLNKLKEDQFNGLGLSSAEIDELFKEIDRLRKIYADQLIAELKQEADASKALRQIRRQRDRGEGKRPQRS